MSLKITLKHLLTKKLGFIGGILKVGVRQACRETLKTITPGMTSCKSGWLAAGEIFRVGHLIGRKIRILKNRKNHALYAIGAGLEPVIGKLPGVRTIAKVVFGALSAIRCSNDLIELSRLSKRCRMLFKGQGYILVKKDHWKRKDFKRGSPSLADGWRWFRYVFLAQIKLAFQTIGAIFKRIFLLALHLSDVYASFRARHTAEVFVYGKELWKSLTSNRSRLVQELKKSKQVVDSMLQKTGSAWTASFLLGLLTVPAKIKQKLPDRRDVEMNLAKTLQGLEERIEASQEVFKNREREFYHRRILKRSYVPPTEKKYRVFIKGSAEDADAMRFILPPNKKNIVQGLH